MKRVLTLAAYVDPDDVPIAAIILDQDGYEIVSAMNETKSKGDSTAHAEILAIRALGSNYRVGSDRELTLVVNLEPCPMCAWAIRKSRIDRLIFGAFNDEYGAAGSVYDLTRDRSQGSTVEVLGGVLRDECGRILKDYFRKLR